MKAMVTGLGFLLIFGLIPANAWSQTEEGGVQQRRDEFQQRREERQENRQERRDARQENRQGRQDARPDRHGKGDKMLVRKIVKDVKMPGRTDGKGDKMFGRTGGRIEEVIPRGEAVPSLVNAKVVSEAGRV